MNYFIFTLFLVFKAYLFSYVQFISSFCVLFFINCKKKKKEKNRRRNTGFHLFPIFLTSCSARDPLTSLPPALANRIEGVLLHETR